MADEIKCPVCGSETTLRTVKKGIDTGKQFYVCNRYPECNGRVQLHKKSAFGKKLINFAYVSNIACFVGIVIIMAIMFYQDRMLTKVELASFGCLSISTISGLWATLTKDKDKQKGFTMIAVSFFLVGMFAQLLSLVDTRTTINDIQHTINAVNGSIH